MNKQPDKRAKHYSYKKKGLVPIPPIYVELPLKEDFRRWAKEEERTLTAFVRLVLKAYWLDRHAKEANVTR